MLKGFVNKYLWKVIFAVLVSICLLFMLYDYMIIFVIFYFVIFDLYLFYLYLYWVIRFIFDLYDAIELYNQT